jgi:hypothetical protein
LAVLDNTKTGVSKATAMIWISTRPLRRALWLRRGAGATVQTARKAIVENAAQVAQRWIVAALRHRKFFSQEEANQAIRELVHRLNHRPFRKREGSLASVFE